MSGVMRRDAGVDHGAAELMRTEHRVVLLPPRHGRGAQLGAEGAQRRQLARSLVASAARGIEQDHRQQAVVLQIAQQRLEPPRSAPSGREMAQRIRRDEAPAAVGQDVAHRHRAQLLDDHVRPRPAHLGEPGGDDVGVREGGREQQQTAALRGEHEDLFPGRAPLRIGQVVGLVQHDEVRHRGRAVQRVAQDLGRGDDDRGLGIDAALAGEQSDGVRAVEATEPMEFLVGEGLERCRVPGGLPLCEELRHRLLRDPGLPAPGRRRDEDITQAHGGEGGFLEGRGDERGRRGCPDVFEDRAKLTGGGTSNGLSDGKSGSRHVRL